MYIEMWAILPAHISMFIDMLGKIVQNQKRVDQLRRIRVIDVTLRFIARRIWVVGVGGPHAS